MNKYLYPTKRKLGKRPTHKDSDYVCPIHLNSFCPTQCPIHRMLQKCWMNGQTTNGWQTTEPVIYPHTLQWDLVATLTKMSLHLTLWMWIHAAPCFANICGRIRNASSEPGPQKTFTHASAYPMTWIKRLQEGRPCGREPSQRRLGPGSLCCSVCTWTNISQTTRYRETIRD